MAKFIDLTGKRFGRILVIKRVPNKGKKTRYLVSCNCGSIKEMAAYTITTHKGCGCLRLERCKAGIRKTETDPKILLQRKLRYARTNRDGWLRRKAGTTLKEFERKIKKQKGLCAICRHRPATHADHNHVSGKSRGVLCRQCNVGLGLFLDNIKILRKSIKYLEKYNE